MPTGIKDQIYEQLGCVFSLRTKKFLLGYFFASLIAGLGFAVWRTILMLQYYEPYTKEYAFEAKSSLEIFGFTLFIVLLLLATASFFFVKIKFLGGECEFSEVSASNHQSTVFTSALLGFLFLAVFVFLAFSLKEMMLPSYYKTYQALQLISFLLLPFVGIYFILNSLESSRFDHIKKIFSFIPTLWCVIFLIDSYLNPMYLYNDFNHTLCNVSLCALVCFFLYETKTVIRKKANAAHFVFSLLAIVLCMAYIVPNFILLAYWELSSELHFIFEAIQLGAIIYMASVSLILISSLKKCESPEVETEYMDFEEYSEFVKKNQDSTES